MGKNKIDFYDKIVEKPPEIAIKTLVSLSRALEGMIADLKKEIRAIKEAKNANA